MWKLPNQWKLFSQSEISFFDWSVKLKRPYLALKKKKGKKKEKRVLWNEISVINWNEMLTCSLFFYYTHYHILNSVSHFIFHIADFVAFFFFFVVVHLVFAPNYYFHPSIMFLLYISTYCMTSLCFADLSLEDPFFQFTPRVLYRNMKMSKSYSVYVDL